MKKIISVLLILLLLSASASAENIAYWIKGYKYYPLYPICQDKEIEYSWDNTARTATLHKNYVEARIRVGSDRLLINGEKLEDIGPPIYYYKGTVLAPTSFTHEKLDKIFKAKKSVSKRKEKDTAHLGRTVMVRPAKVRTINTVVIDPGHGGKDPGATGRYYRTKEKKITLDVAKRLERLLLAEGVKVYLTRGRDVFIPLSERAEIANNRRADFFISIHANSSRSKELRGFEVYYLSEKTDDSQRALDAANNSFMDFEEYCLEKYNKTAEVIACDLRFTENRVESRELAKCLLNSVRNDVYVRGNSLRSARFHVLKNVKVDMPAALVEIGYLSNKSEETLIRTPEYRDKIAQGLARGILAYKKEYERTNGFTR